MLIVDFFFDNFVYTSVSAVGYTIVKVIKIETVERLSYSKI